MERRGFLGSLLAGSALGSEGATEVAERFRCWAVVDVMGHTRYVGYVSEYGPFIRVDVPDCRGTPAFSKVFSPGAIHSITPCSEQTAKEVMRQLEAKPLTLFNVPTQRRLGYDDDDEREPF
jgi:hypothetical protein